WYRRCPAVGRPVFGSQPESKGAGMRRPLGYGRRSFWSRPYLRMTARGEKRLLLQDIELTKTIESGEEGVDFLFGGIEMRPHAYAAARPIIDEDPSGDERSAGSLGAVEIDADPAGAALRLKRRVYRETAFQRHRRDAIGEADVMAPNDVYADRANNVVARLRDHISGDGRRTVTEAIHRGSVRDRRRFELERPRMRHPARHGRAQRFAQAFADVDPAAAGPAAEPLVRTAGRHIQVEIDDVVGIDSGGL